MKSIFFSILFFTVTIGISQTSPPQAFNYSGVARNASGNPIASQTIGLQLTILKNSALGSVQYQENHFVNTDGLGLFNVAVGTGAIQQGVFSNISWDNDNYYLKVGLDATGGTSFVTMGTTQLLSVPYAFHSKTADSVINAVVTELDPVFTSSISSSITSSDTANWNSKQDPLTQGAGISINNNVISVSSPGFVHYVGEVFGGGVVFHVYKDVNGVEHGLIVSLNDFGTSVTWGLSGTNVVNCESSWNGLQNSAAIISAGGLPTDAAGLCNASTDNGQTDWYLPSILELKSLTDELFTVNQALANTAGGVEIQYGVSYWSSTELDAINAHNIQLYMSTPTNNAKTLACRVRGIRKF